jgi:glycosyltransferase involved in cell wall biosynthesis
MYRLHRGLAGHAYWRGVHAGLGSLEALEKLMQDAPLEPAAALEVDVDLVAGRAELESTLHGNADSVRLWWKGRPIGRIPPRAGAACVSPVDVRNEAIQYFARALVEGNFVPARWKPLIPICEPAGIARDARRSSTQRTRVAQFEFGAPDHVWGLQGFDTVQLLATLAGRPLAHVRLPLRPGTAVLSPPELLDALVRRGVHGDAVGRTGTWASPPVSVVVCTRDRPHALRRCLASLAKLNYGNFEVIVIDRASAGEETASLVSETPFRYAREERSGLDWARNRGIAESRHEIVAYLDDVAIASPDWLAAIAAALEDPAVSAVTGLLLPAELSFPSQHQFAEYRQLGHRLDRVDLAGSQMSSAQKIAAHSAGTGANMAFRRRTFECVGMFDTGLDIRERCEGGGDLDLFFRILEAGLTVRHEPAAFVWYYPWRDTALLRRQLHADGRAFGAYLLNVLRSGAVPRRSAIWHALHGWLGERFTRCEPSPEREALPKGLAWAEIRGAVDALWAHAIDSTAGRRRQARSTLRSGLAA